jgi:hypothetical protein
VLHGPAAIPEGDMSRRQVRVDAGKQLTERSYADWVAHQSDALPHTSSLQRYGGFAAVAAEAQRRYDASAAAPHAR